MPTSQNRHMTRAKVNRDRNTRIPSRNRPIRTPCFVDKRNRPLFFLGCTLNSELFSIRSTKSFPSHKRNTDSRLRNIGCCSMGPRRCCLALSRLSRRDKRALVFFFAIGIWTSYLVVRQGLNRPFHNGCHCNTRILLLYTRSRRAGKNGPWSAERLGLPDLSQLESYLS